MTVRRSGVLLHPTCLPGHFGIGDLGSAAIEWLDFLEAAEQQGWQVLPPNPAGGDGCPYQSGTTLAGNPLLISPERLVEMGLLDDAGPALLPDDRVDYPAVTAAKRELLAEAYRHFTPTAATERFAHEQSWWLDDYARYMTLRERHGGPWTSWPAPYATRQPWALRELDESAADRLGYYRFEQWLFAEQYATVRAEAARRGIRIIGDLAMFVGADSCETWSEPGLFQLDGHGRAQFVAGFPPDEFSTEGQVWGNALYGWEAMSGDNYAWWVAGSGE
jgi:4-alpha-glucanotransferase